MKTDINEIIIAFVLGVASSLGAELIIVYFNSISIVKRAINAIVKHQGLKRLRHLQTESVVGSDDPRALVRAQWANNLYDIGSINSSTVQKALQSLLHMADLLENEERDAALEALKYRYAMNQLRNMDELFLRTMQKLRAL